MMKFINPWILAIGLVGVIAVNSLGDTFSSSAAAATSSTPTQVFVQTNFPNPAVTGTTSATSLLSTGVGSLTLPANYFTTAGQVLTIDWTGFFNDVNTTQADTYTLKLGTYTAWLGSTPTLTAINGAALCEAHFMMTTPTVGAGGTIIGAQNNILCESNANNAVILNIPTSAAMTSAFDTTVSHVITFTVTPGFSTQTFTTTTNFVVKGY